jgi:hypothetical protein
LIAAIIDSCDKKSPYTNAVAGNRLYDDLQNHFKSEPSSGNFEEEGGAIIRDVPYIPLSAFQQEEKGFGKKMTSTTSKPQTEHLPFASWSVAVQKLGGCGTLVKRFDKSLSLREQWVQLKLYKKICRGP